MKTDYTDAEWTLFTPGIRFRKYEKPRIFISETNVIHILDKQMSFPIEAKNDHGFWMEYFTFGKCQQVPLFKM